MVDLMSAEEAAASAEGVLRRADERAENREPAVAELLAVAQVYATLAVAERLEKLADAVESADVNLSSIRLALENMRR
jgi:hypothetical protein